MSTREMCLGSGAQPTAALSQLGGRAGCVRALPSPGSPATALGGEKPGRSTAQDNLREGASQGRGGENVFQAEPSISKGRTGAQRGHENRSPPPLLSVFVSFYLPSAA